jgi:hypothetical protein
VANPDKPCRTPAQSGWPTNKILATIKLEYQNAAHSGGHMNRIYQGKVTNVEIIQNGKPEPLKDWQNALWQHHQLFQAGRDAAVVCGKRRQLLHPRPRWDGVITGEHHA